MRKPAQLFREPHLEVREISILPGSEWVANLSGWMLIQVKSGTGYWLHTESSRLLEAGTALLVSEHIRGSIRASQLCNLSLYSFNITPSRLSGLVTLGEQDFLRMAAFRSDSAIRIFPPGDPIALKMSELCVGRRSGRLLFRLKLLQLFAEIFGGEIEQETPKAETSNAKERLRNYLTEIPPDDLLEMNFNDLAEVVRCTPRHLGRIFHDVVGMSFREKRAEIRLARARELLATSNSKVVEVALESGYKSLSLFNLMFTRRFGTSPGRWRQHHAHNCGVESNQSRRQQRIAAWRK